MHLPSPAEPTQRSHHPPYPPQGSIPPWGYGSAHPPPARNPALVWIFVGVGVLFFFGLLVSLAVGIAIGARADGRAARGSDPATTTTTGAPAAAGVPDEAPTAKGLPTPRRNVPVHSTSMLRGCSSSDLDLVERRIGAAIALGAPTYNRGDFQGCFSTYERSARSIELTLPSSCEGPAAALAAGRTRAAILSSPADRAWAMRDAFDGLLDVIDRSR